MTIAEMPAPTLLERRQLKRCDNSSGTPGVCLTMKRFGKLYWTVEERQRHLKMLVEMQDASCRDPFERDARGCESSLAGPFMPW